MSVPSGSRVRDRTRRAVLLAGIAVLARDPSASLGEIASAAGVSRSTLHRYFADRAALLADIEALVEDEFTEALDAARVDEGSGLAGFERLLGELLDRLPVLAWWVRTAAQDDEFDTEPDRRTAELLERGQRDGSVDPALDARWVMIAMWSSLWAVHHESGRGVRTTRELREMCLRVLLKTAAA